MTQCLNREWALTITITLKFRAGKESLILPVFNDKVGWRPLFEVVGCQEVGVSEIFPPKFRYLRLLIQLTSLTFLTSYIDFGITYATYESADELRIV